MFSVQFTCTSNFFLVNKPQDCFMFIIFSLLFFRVLSFLTSAAFPGGQGGGNLRDGEYKLAQSGDATCNGLDSAEVRLINYSLYHWETCDKIIM